MGIEFIDIIKKAKQESNLIAVYTDKDDVNSFSVGYVLEQIEEGLILQTIDVNGYDDGLMFMCLLDIYQIEKDSIYLKNLMRVYRNHSSVKYSNEFIFTRNKEKSLIVDFLNRCMCDNKLISLTLFFGKEIIGFINKISDKMIIVNAITNEGENNGVSCLKIEDINRVYMDNIDHKRIAILLNPDNDPH